MRKTAFFISIIILSIIFSFVKISEKKTLKRIFEYSFLSNEYLTITSFEVSYKQNQIDSIKYNTRDIDKRYTLNYKKNKNITEVFKHSNKNKKSIKKYEYKFNSENKLSSFLTFDSTKLMNIDVFTYNKNIHTITKFTTQNFLWFDSANYYKTTYYIDNVGNIDSSFLYKHVNKDSIFLIETKKYKYDDKINPFKDLLFLEINNRYFNSNNIISEFSTNHLSNIKDSIVYKFDYDSLGYIIKRTAGNFPHSKNSFANKYIY